MIAEGDYGGMGKRHIYVGELGSHHCSLANVFVFVYKI